MSIGTFTHTWKVTKIQKFGSKTVEHSDLSGNTTTYTDLVSGVWATLKTTNQHEDHADESHYVERDFNWEWKYCPIKYMDPVGFITYTNLTESDYGITVGPGQNWGDVKNKDAETNHFPDYLVYNSDQTVGPHFDVKNGLRETIISSDINPGDKSYFLLYGLGCLVARKAMKLVEDRDR